MKATAGGTSTKSALRRAKIVAQVRQRAECACSVQSHDLLYFNSPRKAELLTAHVIFTEVLNQCAQCNPGQGGDKEPCFQASNQTRPVHFCPYLVLKGPFLPTLWMWRLQRLCSSRQCVKFHEVEKDEWSHYSYIMAFIHILIKQLKPPIYLHYLLIHLFRETKG